MSTPTTNGLIDDYADTLTDTNSALPTLIIGTSITGSIEDNADADVFAVSLNAGAHYAFGLKGADTGSGSLADPYLTVLDATGAVVASDDDSGIYNNALLPDFVAPATGTYYLVASATNNTATGSYTLTTADNSNAASVNLTGSVFIIGTFIQGQTLYAACNLVDINGYSGNIVYHWWSNNVEIGVGSSFILSELQVNTNISVTASYSSFSSTTIINVSSNVSATPVVNVNDPLSGEVVITGEYTQGQTLTASNTFIDADGVGVVSYAWYTNNVYMTTANSYSLTETEVGKTISVTASYTDGHGTVETQSTDMTNAPVVTNLNDAPTGELILTGNALQGQTLRVSNTLADTDGLGVISYSWQENGLVVATGTSYTLTEADVGASIQVIASYTDQRGTVETVSSALTDSIANLNDLPTGTVSITGTLVQGQTLSASNTLADADGLGVISYRWQAGNSVVGTEQTYTLNKTDVGKNMVVIASYTDAHGTQESVSSSVTGQVSNINTPPTGAVSITGVLKQGQTLIANNSLVDADGLGSITYTWQANNVTFATGASYTLTEAQVGKSISVTASYIDGYNSYESVSSKASNAVVNINDPHTGTVSINGTLLQGQTLTASHTLADIDGMGVVSYQWKASGVNIGTSSSYTLTANEINKKITVVASYTDGHGTQESQTSPATGLVQGINHLPTGKVSITGATTQGQVLTASNTLADVDGLGTISYQWFADSTKLGKGASLTLTEAQVGKVITVQASYTDGHNILESVTSAASRPIANVNDAPTGKVTLSGVATQNQKLTVANTLNDADGMGNVVYTWKADATKFATGTNVVLAEAQVGKVITVQASYTDGHGKVETVTSNATRAVVNVNDAPEGTVTIKGIVAEGKTLTAVNNLTDPDGMGAITYTWKTGATVLATGNTFVPSSTEAGKKLLVLASYTDGNGSVEKVASAVSTAVVNIDPTVKITALNGFATAENNGNGTSVSAPKSITFDIALKTRPIHNVTLSFSSSDTTEGVISSVAGVAKATATMTFTSSNWNVAQKLIVTGVNDYLNDGGITYQLNTKVTSIDVDYKALLVPSLDLINKDDGRDVAQDIYGDVGGSKIDKITGMDGNDKIHGLNMADDLSGAIGNDTLWGGYGDDNLFGNDGNDYLWGEQENDYLDGGTGTDTLDGGTGTDTMIGGVGNDTYYLGYDATDVIQDGGLSNEVDTVIMPYQLSSYTLPTGIEVGTITDGTQDSSLTGNSGDNTLNGNAGNNSLNGGLGRDTLFGGVGADDVNGGTGSDALTGGSGADDFIFNTPLATTNIDTVLDFNVANDTFKLSQSIFTNLALGNLSTSAFQIGAMAIRSADRVIYNQTTGALYYDDDGAGSHAALQVATLGVNLALTAADFVVIA